MNRLVFPNVLAFALLTALPAAALAGESSLAHAQSVKASAASEDGDSAGAEMAADEDQEASEEEASEGDDADYDEAESDDDAEASEDESDEEGQDE